MNQLDQLWAGWRSGYIADDEARLSPEPGLSLFESIEQSELDDSETFIVHRGELTFVVLNAYPYSNGHMLVMPRRAVPDLAGLSEDEHREMWDTVRTAVAVLDAAFAPDGVNIGINLGVGAGAGLPEHLHVHCVPRWSGDTNFMTSTANVRVLPESLIDTWEKLRACWGTVSGG
ncbi:MAG: HIT domain-containing protein [Acidobacteria bacterium]|nr:HIT domain-containing protein [Acidobacteriota bacterium]